MTISEYLASQKAINEPIVATFLDTIEARYQSLSPENARLIAELKLYLRRGGKWHRPALALLGYHIAGGVDEQPVRPSLAALEVLHRYILIHDDIIDQDLLRHDGPTIEHIYRTDFSAKHPHQNADLYGKGIAIVAGDIVCCIAYELLTQTSVDTAIVVAATRAFNQLMMETVAGWQIQTEQNYLPIQDVSKEAIIHGMTLVSAQYSVVWPLRIGQVFAGKPERNDWDSHLEAYGLAAGLAFQITDDILGMFGDPAKTGKPVGHDYREGKKTLLVHIAYERASIEEKKFFDTTLGTSVSEVEVMRARQIMETTGALAEVQALATHYATTAKQAITSISSPRRDELALLNELADLFAHRSY